MLEKMTCVNTSSRDFQILKLKSGISEDTLAIITGIHLDKYGVYPELDEILGANSEPYLIELIKMNKNGGAEISNILKYTGTTSIEDAVKVLNKLHSDLQIEILPINSLAIVKILHKASQYSLKEGEDIPLESLLDSLVGITNMLNKLLSLYGIETKIVTTELLNSLGVDPLVKGAIIDGIIYINTDFSTIDTPIHELMHILIGGVKLHHPDLYRKLVEAALNFANYDEIALNYPNRTLLDLLEEVLVTELAKFLVEKENSISELSEAEQDLIMKDFSRVLDAALMGTESVEIVDWRNHTLRSLAKVIHSTLFKERFKGTIDDAAINRQLANLKSELIKNNDLVEECI